MDSLRLRKNFRICSPGGTPNGLHKIIDTTGFGGNSFFLKIENTVFANAGSFSWELHRNPHGYSFNLIELFTDRISIKEIDILSANTIAEREYFYSPTVPTTLTLAPGSISE